MWPKSLSERLQLLVVNDRDRVDHEVLDRLDPDVFDTNLVPNSVAEFFVLTETDNEAARRLYAKAGGIERSTVYVTFDLAGTNGEESK